MPDVLNELLGEAARSAGGRVGLAYLPAGPVLADRLRRQRNDRQGASDVPAEQRDD